MRQPVDDSSRRSIAIRLIGLIIAAALPALIAFPADQRPLIFRIALAAGLVVLLFSLLGRLFASIRNDDPDGFERALEPSMPPVHLDATLGQLRDEIRYSRSSRRYFEKMLWPRLRALTARHGHGAEDEPAPRTTGWLKRRGPSVRDLNQLIDHLETRE